MSKDEILQRYLNTIFFGNNAYGLQAAAEVYFGKNVEDLEMIEGAFLAGLIRSPSGYDPINKPERSRARFRQVTERLADVEIMTTEEAEALAEEYVLPERLQTIPTLSTKPTYYTDALREYLLERSNILGDTEQARANELIAAGCASSRPSIRRSRRSQRRHATSCRTPPSASTLRSSRSTRRRERSGRWWGTRVRPTRA